MRWLDEGIQFDYGKIEGTEASWAHLYGANGSMKRALVERVGGYDEERLPYLYEDLDFAYRARRHGLRVIYNPRALVDHYRPGMTLQFWKEKAHRLAASERAFVAIHPEMEPWFFNMFSAAARSGARTRPRREARPVRARVGSVARPARLGGGATGSTCRRWLGRSSRRGRRRRRAR